MPSFQDLPVPILYQILAYVPDVTTVVLLECTCRDFRRASLEFSLWEDLHRRRWSYSSANNVNNKADYARRHQLDKDTLVRVRNLEKVEFATEDLLSPLLKRGREALDVCWSYHQENPRLFTTRVLYNLQRAAIFDELIDVHYRPAPDGERLENYAILSGLLNSDDLFRNYEERVQLIRDELDALASRAQCACTASDGTQSKILALNSVLFEQEGFSGNVDNYYDYHNSLLHCALERKTAIPMTLAILYKLLAKRLGIQVDIIGLPGHIVVGVPQLEDTYLDVFHQGRFLQVPDLVTIVGGYGIPFRPTFLTPLSPQDTFRRVCNNLRNQNNQDDEPTHRLLMVVLMSLLLVNHNRILLAEKCYNGLRRRWNSVTLQETQTMDDN